MGKRLFQLNGSEMNYRINDMTYGLLLYYANYKKEDEKLYVDKDYVTDFEEILGKGYTLHTIKDKHIKKLKDEALVTDGEYVWYKTKRKAYVMKNKTDKKDAPYQTIDTEIIYKIIDEIRLVNSLRIYVYLLNKYRMAKKAGFEDVMFSLLEISTAIGYAATSKRQNKMIREIIEKLESIGLISYEAAIKERYSDKSYKLLYVKEKI